MLESTTEEEFGFTLEQGDGDHLAQSRLTRSDKAMVVMVVHNPSNPIPPCDQLIGEARVTVPAVLNMLLFRSSPLAVMYFGKQFTGGKKCGLDCADDLKFRMLRFLMSEIWPPLLRTDLPDESSPGAGHVPASDKDWQRSSIEQGMEVLLYLKQAPGGGKYLKLILTNPLRRIHFDITSAKEEKHRWDNRMLHVRMLDNLETQKAVPSYDVYEQYFNDACQLSQTLAASTGPDLDSLLPMTTRTDKPYKYFERLEKPESTTLDYKSYFSNPAQEIEHKAVKFMCGFLNALGMGKIVVGVYEMPRFSGPVSSPQASLHSGSDFASSNSIVTHNMLVEQIVVGVSITDEQLQGLCESLSAQLADCLPPIPPACVSIESVPVVLPTQRLEPAQILILHDTQLSGARESFRSKSNFAIRQLGRSSIALCPLELSHYPCLAPLLPPQTVVEQMYAMIPCSEEAAQLMSREGWVTDILLTGLDKTRGRGFHRAVTYESGITLPSLRVLEISVERKKFPAAYQQYDGKFFCGWPSIPLWDPVTSSIRSVERNYNIRSGVSQAHHSAPVWLTQNQVLATVFDFLCGPRGEDLHELLNLRLVHSLLNAEHDSRLGTDVVTLLQRTPPGGAVVQASTQAIVGIQGLLRSAQLALMPLLLCRIYGSLGLLPSPFPFVAVPLAFQAMRVSAALIPIYFLHTPHMGVLRIAVVLDKCDGLLKTIRWKDNGQRVVQTIVGVGFDRAEAIQPLSMHAREGRRASAACGSPVRSSSHFSAVPPMSKVVRFAFLTGRQDTSHYHGEPWTLRHLLVWLRLAVHDPHATPLLFAEQSFGFSCDAHEICASHLGESRGAWHADTPDSLMSPEPSTIYPSSFDCALHRAMADWSHFALNVPT